MQFVQFASLVRTYTGTNSTTFTDAEILLLANIHKDDIAATIATEVGEGYFGQWFVKDLVAGQREYALPPEMMSRMRYLLAKIDGTNYTRLKETNLQLYKEDISESVIVSNYSTRDSEFFLWGKSIFILSGTAITDVVEGLKLYSIVYPADFTSLSSTSDMSNNPTAYALGFPRQFHELLARRVSISFKSSQERPIPLSEKEQTYEIDLRQKISTLKDENIDRVTAPSWPVYDGSDY